MSARGLLAVIGVTALVSAGLTLYGAWKWLKKDEATAAVPTPTLLPVGAPTPLDPKAPPVAAAYKQVQAAWDRHEARLAEAADPTGYRRALQARVAAAWNQKNLSALMDEGEGLFRRDVGNWRPAPRTFRRVHLGQLGGPGATRCASCHWQPVLGGGGSLADNTFFDGDGETLSSALTRNPPSLHGAALLSLLAEEMTAELQSQARDIEEKAATSGENVTEALHAKGVSFGRLTVAPNGFRDASAVEGVSEDLVVRPFGWKGTSASLSQSIEEGLRLSMGMRPEELGDGGVQAIEVFVATLPPPTLRPPALVDQQLRWEQGSKRFEEIGCASCHVPYLTLENPVYRVGDLEVNLAEVLHLEKNPEGTGYRVQLFSDLRRHAMGEALAEGHEHRGIPADQFRTPALWGLDGTHPFLHDGRALTSFDAAIAAHGGEGADAAAKYLALPTAGQGEIRAFLRGLSREPRMRVAGP